MSFIIDSPFLPTSIFLRSSNATTVNSNKNISFFQFNEYIPSQSNMDILLKFNSFQFTNSVYNVNSNNNSFFWQVAGSLNLYFIPYGFYSIDDLMLQMNTDLVSYGFNFSYSTKTLKVTITNATPFYISNSTTNSIFNANELLGFNDIALGHDTSLATSKTAPFLFNMQGLQCINICTDIQLNNINIQSGQTYNILACIPVTSTFGEVQRNLNMSQFQYILDEQSIGSISIYMLDQDFNPINWNGIDWFINLEFNSVYKKTYIPVETLTEFHDRNALYNELLFHEQQNKKLLKTNTKK